MNIGLAGLQFIHREAPHQKKKKKKKKDTTFHFSYYYLSLDDKEYNQKHMNKNINNRPV